MSNHDHFKLEIKARMGIVECLSRYGVACKSGGKRKFKICCPIHVEKTPSCMIDEDKQRFHCYGCGAGGDIFSFIAAYENLGDDFKAALKIAAQMVGLSRDGFAINPVVAKQRETQVAALQQRMAETAEHTRKRSFARIGNILHDCVPAVGSLVEQYFKSRYIIDDWEALAALKFCPSLTYYNYDTGVKMGDHPAMVALITDVDRHIIGLHVTYLTADGTKLRLFDADGKLLPAKKMIGKHMDGVIRLCSSEGCEVIWIAEGIESARSAAIMHNIPVWAAASSANFATGALLKMPIKAVGLVLDNDSKDPKSYRDIWMRAAKTWSDRGWKVKRLVPDYGTDYNDLLKQLTLDKKVAQYG